MSKRSGAQRMARHQAKVERKYPWRMWSQRMLERTSVFRMLGEIQRLISVVTP